MKIEITDYSHLDGFNSWWKERIRIYFFDPEDNSEIQMLCNAEEAKELAQELLHCYNKLMHWAENQEEREE